MSDVQSGGENYGNQGSGGQSGQSRGNQGGGSQGWQGGYGHEVQQLIREATANAVRHGSASRATFAVARDDSESDWLRAGSQRGAASRTNVPLLCSPFAYSTYRGS